MSYQQKDNTGSLFKNEGERKRENGPGYSGTALIDGTEYFMDAWLKSAESGRKWMSFSFKPKQKQAASKPQAPQRTHGQMKRGSMDDYSDVPF